MGRAIVFRDILSDAAVPFGAAGVPWAGNSGLGSGAPVGISLGDSTALHDSSNGAHSGGIPDSLSSQANGYLTWARFLSGQRVSIPADTNVWAFFGQTLETCLSYIDAAVAASPVKPGFAVLQGGTNNMTDGVSTFATMKATMTTALQKCFDYGMRVILIPVVPRSGQSAAAYAMIDQYNRWLYSLPERTGGLVAIASAAMKFLSDPTATAGATALAAMFVDATHPNTNGGRVIGEAIAAIINTWYPPVDILPITSFPFDAVNNPRGDGLINQLMRNTGTPGTVTAGAGLTNTGAAAEGWTASGSGPTGLTITHSLVTSALSGLPMHQMAFSGTYTKSGVTNPAYDVYGRLYQNAPNPFLASLQVGDVIEAAAAVEIDAASSNITFPMLQMRRGSSSRFNADFNQDGATYRTVGQLPNKVITGVMRTAPYMVQASDLPFSAASIGVFLFAHAPCVNGTFTPNATVRFGQATLRKVER